MISANVFGDIKLCFTLPKYYKTFDLPWYIYIYVCVCVCVLGHNFNQNIREKLRKVLSAIIKAKPNGQFKLGKIIN